MKGNLMVGLGLSTESQPNKAAREAIKMALGQMDGALASMGLIFLSPKYAVKSVLDEIRENLGDIPFLGCTTAGEIFNGPKEESFSIILLSSPYIEAEVCHVEYDQADPDGAIQRLLTQDVVKKAINEEYRREISRQGKRSFGILFVPGVTRTQDSPYFEVFQALKEAVGESVPIVGGCAGDYWQLQSSWVLSPAGVLENSIGFMLVTTSLRFGIGMCNGFEPTNRIATVTKVAGYTVLELNGQPAMEVLPWLFQTSQEDLLGSHVALRTGKVLGIQDRFASYQLVVPRYITQEGGLRLSQPLYPNTQIQVMRPGEKITQTARDAITRALIRAGVEYPSISFIFSCALQWKLVSEEKKTEEYQAIKSAYGDVSLAGFYSMGEYGLSLEGTNRACNGAVSALVLSDELWDAAEIYLENQRLLASLEEKQVRLEEAYKEWEFTFDVIPISIAILDRDFRIRKINKTMADSLSMSKEEAIGKECFRLVHNLDRPRDDCLLASLYLDGHPKMKEMYEPGLGGWNLVGVAPFKYEEGKVSGAVHFAININAKKQLEAANERLKRFELTSTISSGISHDFNNLLMIILGNIELAMMKLKRDEQAYQYLTKVKDTVSLAAELVRRFAISSGNIIASPIKVDLESLIKKIALSKIQGSHIKLSFEKKERLYTLNVDAELIRKAFENIIDNALESMGDKGELKILCELKRFSENEVDLAPGDYVRITVEDTGKGIAPEHLDKIFDPYFSTKARGYQKGMGLGLSEALAIVHLHGGTIWVESRVGIGTKVHVFLPISGEA